MNFHEYINNKNEVHELILNFIDDDIQESSDESFQSLIQYLTEKKFKKNRDDLKNLLYFISNIANNHHRGPFLFSKIEKIIDYLKDDIKKTFSNYEIFDIFQDNKRILLFLFDSQILIFDSMIYDYFQKGNFFTNSNFLFYFYKEIRTFFDQKIRNLNSIEATDNLFFGKKNFNVKYFVEDNKNINIDQQYREEVNDYDEKRHNGENESILCSLIRNDSINEFIYHINSSQVKLNSLIKMSKYETNPLLFNSQYAIKIIDYTAFFGSIQIFKYLLSNDAKLTPSIWLFAIHGRNPEIIHLIEERNFKIDYKSLLDEAIKCNHNEIVSYILNKYENFTNDDIIKTYFLYNNFAILPDEIDMKKLLLFLIANSNYSDLVKLMLKEDSSLIGSKADEELFIKTASQNYRFDIVHVLLSVIGIEIKPKLFQFFNILKTFIIPESIKVIGDYSFDQCTSLTEITFPSSLTSIGKYAFRKCSSLKSITIPSVDSIEYSAFAECSSLVNVSILASLTVIQFFTFEKCSSLKEINIPSSVSSIQKGAFDGCSSLVSIYIPSSVDFIGECAFRNCKSLKKFSIPSLVKEIKESTFQQCLALNEVTFGNPCYLCKIGVKAFLGCESLKKISIPSSVKLINIKAFYKCSSLSEVSFENPPSIAEIKEDAFQFCPSLEEISVPSATSIDKFAFQPETKQILS